MPTTSGTSILGLQLLGSMPVQTTRFANLFLTSLDINRRLDRYGTALICFNNGIDQRPTSQVIKVYGNGFAMAFPSTLPGVALEVWVRWFQAGVTWQLTT